MTERLIYLLIIAGLLLIMSYEFYWFTKHYEFLMQGFNIVWENCKL